jgi:hypothetical protein
VPIENNVADIMPAHIDAQHQLRGAGIHDAEMRRIELVPGERFAIILRGTDGIERQLVLDGLAEIGLEHLTNGMIVIYIYAWTLDAGAASDRQGWKEAWETLLGDRCSANQLSAATDRLRRRHDGLKLVYIVTAYGGAVAAICREIGWRQLPGASEPAEPLASLYAKLNSLDHVPQIAYRRNHMLYELVCYVNCIIGAQLSSNAGAIETFTGRAREYIEANPPRPDAEEYYALVRRLIAAASRTEPASQPGSVAGAPE